MSRTARYKFGYIVSLLLVGSLAVFAIIASGGGVLPLVIVAAVLLIPGRMLGIAYRDLFRGRRLLDMRQAEASISHTLRFLEYVRKHPGRKRLLSLAWSVYTPDAEAMALNNLGAAQLEVGDFKAATDSLKAALAVDSKYPLPHYNLAIERTIANDMVTALQHATEAERLGFRGTRIDAIVRESQSLLARLEGRKIKAE